MELKASVIIPKFLSEIDLRIETKKFYNCILNNYCRWLSTKRIEFDKVKLNDVIDYKNHLKDKNKSTRTVNKYMQVVNVFYRYLDDEGVYPNKYYTSIRKEKVSNSFSRYALTVDQLKALLSIPDQNTPKGRRDYCILLLLSHLGLRRIEASRLTIEDIVQHSGEYWLRLQRKGEGKGTMKAIDSDIYNSLVEMIEDRNVTDFKQHLFITIGNSSKNKAIDPHRLSQVVKEYMIKNGLNSRYYTAHSLRHTCAHILLRSGMTVEELRVYLGHKSISTTQIYIRQISQEFESNKKGLLLIKNSVQ